MFSPNRYILCIFLLFAVLVTHAQERQYFGRIVNRDNKGLPNSFVKVDKANQSFYCDDNGVFQFKINAKETDTFIFYAQGYDKVKVVADELPEDSIIVELKKSTRNLQDVSIIAKSGNARIREGVAGSTKWLHNGGCYLTFKDEIAMFLPVDSNRKALLNEVNVYITKDGITTNKFLIHLYLPDSTGAPGEEVTDSNLVVSARKGNEWVSADLSDHKIQVKGGLFVSVEWIIGYGNDGLPWPMNEVSNYYAGNDSLRTFYNGQVLGLTWVNGDMPKVYRRYARSTYEKTAPDKWFLTSPLVGGCKRNECIAPMMYFTYSYIER